MYCACCTANGALGGAAGWQHLKRIARCLRYAFCADAAVALVLLCSGARRSRKTKNEGSYITCGVHLNVIRYQVCRIDIMVHIVWYRYHAIYPKKDYNIGISLKYYRYWYQYIPIFPRYRYRYIPKISHRYRKFYYFCRYDTTIPNTTAVVSNINMEAFCQGAIILDQ